MIDWKVILFIVLLTLIIGYIWFDNIRWTIRFWRKEGLNKPVDILSGKVINNAQNDKRDYNPEPNSVFSVEITDCLTNLDTKPYEKDKQATPTQGDCSSLCCPSHVFICLFGHVKRIISRIKRLRNQKRIKPSKYSYFQLPSLPAKEL